MIGSKRLTKRSVEAKAVERGSAIYELMTLR